jgi:hypothetical protein
MAGMVYISVAYAHLCNNVYRSPDRLIVKPEKSVTSVEKSEEVRVFVKNTFPKPVHAVALTARSDDEAVQVTVTPESVDTMMPGDKVDFKLKIKVAEGAPAKEHKLTIGISSKETGFESLEAPPIEKLRQIVQTKSNQSTQVLAAEALVKRDDPLGFEFLKNMATNARQEYRARAVRAMGRVSSEAGLSFLKGMTPQEQDGFVKGNALLALGMGNAEKAMLEREVSNHDNFVKTCAQAALTLSGSKDHIKDLKSALGSDDKCIQIAAAWGLASAGEKEGVEFLDKVISAGGKDARTLIFAGDALISLPEAQGKSKAD